MCTEVSPGRKELAVQHVNTHASRGVPFGSAEREKGEGCTHKCNLSFFVLPLFPKGTNILSDKPEEQGHMAGHSRVWCVDFGQEYNGMCLRGEERGGWREVI